MKTTKNTSVARIRTTYWGWELENPEEVLIHRLRYLLSKADPELVEKLKQKLKEKNNGCDD